MSNEKTMVVFNYDDIWSTEKPMCASCKFIRNISYVSNCYVCSILSALNRLEVWNSDTRSGETDLKALEDSEYRCSECPFNVLPKEYPILKARYPQPDGLHPLYKQGWNDCIKALRGEVIEHPSAEYCETYLTKVSDDIVIGTEDIHQKCECGNEHFSKYISDDQSPVYVCNECKAVYIQDTDKGE